MSPCALAKPFGDNRKSAPMTDNTTCLTTPMTSVKEPQSWGMPSFPCNAHMAKLNT